METTSTHWFTNIGEIKEANRELGCHWFSADTMRFFGSQVLPTVYGGRYFITKEDDFRREKKLYTVREAQPNGDIDTVGEFQAYTTRAEAVKAIKALLS